MGRRESAFSISRIWSRSLEQAIEIRSSLAAYEEITGGFEPNRNEEILWINNETDIYWDVQYVVHGPDNKDVNEYFLPKKRGSELKFVLLVAVTFN